MDDILDSHLNTGQLVITPEVKTYLKETAKWAKLFSIVSFVFLAIMVLVGFTMGSLMTRLIPADDLPAAGMETGFVAAYFLMIAAIYFFPFYYLYKFASNMKKALAADDQAALSISFRNLKSCYKFIGILMVIALIFYGISLIFALLMGIAGFAAG